MGSYWFEKTYKTIQSFSKHPLFGYVMFGIVLLLALFLNSFELLSRSITTALILTTIYATVALGFSLLLGYGGLASLGTAGFVGLGTYLVGHFSGTQDYPFIVSLLIALGVAIVIGLIVGFISLRIEGLYLAIITLGLAEILKEIFKSFEAFTGGNNGLSFRDFDLLGIEMSPLATNVLIVVAFIAVIVMTHNIINSPTGRALLAMKNSTTAAQSMGIGLLKYRLLAFVLSTVYAVFGGLLYMLNQQFSQPTTWSLDFSLNILAAVIVGGAQSIAGIILGTFLIFGLDLAVLQKIPFFVANPNATWIVNGALIILVIMFYPGGLIRLFKNLHASFITQCKKLKKKWSVYRYGEERH